MRISDWSSDVCSADLLALLGGGSAEKQTRLRIERIRASNAPTLTPQQMVSIRLSDNDSGIVLLDGLIKHLVPRPDLLRRRLAQAGLRTSLGKYVKIGRASCRERVCPYV